jgi:outer membrane protein assembly factor BamB
MKFLTTILLGLATTGAFAGDWLQFRGPRCSSVSDEANVSSKLDTNSIAWKASIPGKGLSSPLVIGEKVFVTCSSGPKQERLHVICFSAKDGKKLWERQYWATGRTVCHDKSNVAAPSPASDGKRIYAIFSSNDLVCLDLDGNLVWLRGLTRDYPGASNALGMSSSLVVRDNTVIAMLENEGDSFTMGLDADTGVNRWKMSRPKTANWTSPVIHSSGVVVIQSSKGVTAIEPKSGKVAWESPIDAANIPSLTLEGDMVYVPSNGGMAAMKVEGENQPPKQLWKLKELAAGTASPVALGDRLFIINNASVMTCADVADGKRVWQLRLSGPFSATPVASGNILFCVNEKGLLQAVDTSKPEGEIVSKLDLGQMVLSTPAIANGALYVRSDATLWKVKGS